MMENVQLLKHRIFGIELDNIIYNEPDKFTLEEILETLARESENKDAFIFPLEEQVKPVIKPEEQILIIEEQEKKPKFVFYEVLENLYYVYFRSEEYDIKVRDIPKQEKAEYGLFLPSGVTVNRVSQSILGNGVLGRAFIYSNHIEILDSLMGHEYFEVLTHEVLHILHPEKKEPEIRQMTRNYLGANNTVYH